MLNKFFLILSSSVAAMCLIFLIGGFLPEREKTPTVSGKKVAAKMPTKNKVRIKNTKDGDFKSWAKGWTPEAIRRVKFEYRDSINEAARKHSVDPDIITSVIGIESGGKKNAKGNAGEIGLMQCKPSTCKKYVDPAKLHIPHYNIQAGTKHIRELQIRYKNDLPKIVLAYNAGSAPSTVNPNTLYLKKFNHLMASLKSEKNIY